MEEIIQLNSGAKLSPHFTLGEMTKSSSHPEVYNIPSHEAIANLTNLTKWLEVLRKRYNAKYGVCGGYTCERYGAANTLCSNPFGLC